VGDRKTCVTPQASEGCNDIAKMPVGTTREETPEPALRSCAEPWKRNTVGSQPCEQLTTFLRPSLTMTLGTHFTFLSPALKNHQINKLVVTWCLPSVRHTILSTL
jgi:hypothetical protein